MTGRSEKYKAADSLSNLCQNTFFKPGKTQASEIDASEEITREYQPI